MIIQKERIQKDLEAINAFNGTPGKGVTRFTFSKEHHGALSYVVEELRRIGVESSFVIGGNLRGRLAGSEPSGPSVMMGSHLDSVAEGGRFDGTAVAAALRRLGPSRKEIFPIACPLTWWFLRRRGRALRMGTAGELHLEWPNHLRSARSD